MRPPRRLQDLALRTEAETRNLTAALGRSPSAEEVAGALGVAVDSVLEAREAHLGMHPLSLDRPGTGDDDEDGGALGALIGVVEEGFARAEDRATIGRLLRRIPARDRAVLALRFEHDLTQSEIAARLGVSQMHVCRVLRRSLAELSRPDARGRVPTVER